MELVLIKQDSPEWEFMWNWLESHPLNKGIENPSLATNGTESWQYMGSLQSKQVILSRFRHRNHPLTNNVQHLTVEHKDFNQESIIKKVKL